MFSKSIERSDEAKMRPFIARTIPLNEHEF